jgi:hypothetical protein
VFLGLGVLQWAALGTLLYYAPDIRRWVAGRPAAPTVPREALQ